MGGMVLLNVNFQNFLFFEVLITLVTLVLSVCLKRSDIMENRISPGDMWGVAHPAPFSNCLTQNGDLGGTVDKHTTHL